MKESDKFEPFHKNMVLFIQLTCMHSHPVELDAWFLVRLFVYFHILCVRTAKALARLRRCTGSPEPSLLTYVISTIISWAGSFKEIGLILCRVIQLNFKYSGYKILFSSIPRLLEVVMGSALSFPRIVSSLAKCFYKICRMFGKTFVDKKVCLCQ